MLQFNPHRESDIQRGSRNPYNTHTVRDLQETVALEENVVSSSGVILVSPHVFPLP